MSKMPKINDVVICKKTIYSFFKYKKYQIVGINGFRYIHIKSGGGCGVYSFIIDEDYSCYFYTIEEIRLLKLESL